MILIRVEVDWIDAWLEYWRRSVEKCSYWIEEIGDWWSRGWNSKWHSSSGVQITFRRERFSNCRGGSLNLIEYEIHKNAIVATRKWAENVIHSFWSSCWNCVIKETCKHRVREWTSNHGFGECWPQNVHVLAFLSCFKSLPGCTFAFSFSLCWKFKIFHFEAKSPNFRFDFKIFWISILLMTASSSQKWQYTPN